MDQTARLGRLRALQRLLDGAFRVPGTRIRFGWDPVLGLIPWAGDVAGVILIVLVVAAVPVVVLDWLLDAVVHRPLA